MSTVEQNKKKKYALCNRKGENASYNLRVYPIPKPLCISRNIDINEARTTERLR